MLFREDTGWLTQRALAELSGGQGAVDNHLNNISTCDELDREAEAAKKEREHTK